MIPKSVRGKSPEIGKDCFIAENATIVGVVTNAAYGSMP